MDNNNLTNNTTLTIDSSVLLIELKQASQQMSGVIKSIQNIAKQTNLLSLNSAIEAARAGEAGRGFGVVADEIKKLASHCFDSTKESGTIIDNIINKANEVMGVRTADLAYDVIDKIDRNLFERNCDAQAWAKFDKIKACFLSDAADKIDQANTFLKNIVEIYEVYFDLFILDLDGNIMAAAVNRDQIGRNVSNTDWFKDVKVQNSISVSDFYFSTINNLPTVAYSCPIVDNNGATIGYFSSRFNWNFIYDIIDSAKIGEHGDIYVVNNKGYIIASKNRQGILTKNLSDLPAVQKAIHGETYGYTLDKIGTTTKIIGYAHTRGYNAYSGKNWSTIITEIL